jgi:hypothetical protein
MLELPIRCMLLAIEYRLGLGIVKEVDNVIF